MEQQQLKHRSATWIMASVHSEWVLGTVQKTSDRSNIPSQMPHFTHSLKKKDFRALFKNILNVKPCSKT